MPQFNMASTHSNCHSLFDRPLRLLALRVLILWFCAQCSCLYIPGIYLLFCYITKKNEKSQALTLPFADAIDANKLLRFLPFFAILLWPNLIGFGALSPLQVIWSFVVLRSFWSAWVTYLGPSSPTHSQWYSKMNHLKMSFLEYCWAFCSLGGSATLGWLFGVIRKHVLSALRSNMYTDVDVQHTLHRMLTESMLVMGIKEGDDHQFTSSFSVLVWPERYIDVICRPVLSTASF